MFKKSQNIISKRVAGMEDYAPNLIVKLKQVSPKKYEISIIHPNTKKELYSKVHVAQTAEEAFLIGKSIKTQKFSDVKTWYEEILHIPRPKRGKMALKTKEKNKKSGDEE